MSGGYSGGAAQGHRGSSDSGADEDVRRRVGPAAVCLALPSG
jgi:hypothetical protein